MPSSFSSFDALLGLVDQVIQRDIRQRECRSTNNAHRRRRVVLAGTYMTPTTNEATAPGEQHRRLRQLRAPAGRRAVDQRDQQHQEPELVEQPAHQPPQAQQRVELLPGRAPRSCAAPPAAPRPASPPTATPRRSRSPTAPARGPSAPARRARTAWRPPARPPPPPTRAPGAGRGTAGPGAPCPGRATARRRTRTPRRWPPRAPRRGPRTTPTAARAPCCGLVHAIHVPSTAPSSIASGRSLPGDRLLGILRHRHAAQLLIAHRSSRHLPSLGPFHDHHREAGGRGPGRLAGPVHRVQHVLRAGPAGGTVRHRLGRLPGRHPHPRPRARRSTGGWSASPTSSSMPAPPPTTSATCRTSSPPRGPRQGRGQGADRRGHRLGPASGTATASTGPPTTPTRPPAACTTRCRRQPTASSCTRSRSASPPSARRSVRAAPTLTSGRRSHRATGRGPGNTRAKGKPREPDGVDKVAYLRGLLAQWQSCGLLIRRFRVRVPGGRQILQVRAGAMSTGSPFGASYSSEVQQRTARPCMHRSPH